MKLKDLMTKSFWRDIINRRLSGIACWVVIIVIIITNYQYKFWRDNGRIIAYDVIAYYQYLPATFIYKDLGMHFIVDSKEDYSKKFWVQKTETGRRVGRMTMGVAVMYSPFFLAAHVLAEPLGYKADGYSQPYKYALVFASVLYAGLGLFFLRRSLRKYFPEISTALAILLVGLATNLFFYTVVEPAMSHSFSFFLFTVFIWLMISWLERSTWPGTVLLGLVTGMIVLIRPSNGIIVTLILFWGVAGVSQMKERSILLLKSWAMILVMALVVFLVILPQFLYWKYTTGHYIFYTYDREGFFFNNPQFISGLLSYRKGWLVYTPAMIFALAGLIVLAVRQRGLFYPIFIFSVINMYIIFSWWSWWYGGGFGQRALIESYALMAFPLAAFGQWVLSKNWIVRGIYLTMIGFFIFLNIFQTNQYYYGSIHWDAMSKEAYWDSFLRKRPSERFQGLLRPPDYSKAMNGIYEDKVIAPPLTPDEIAARDEKAEFVRNAEATIRNTPGWLEHMKEKAAFWNISVDSAIRKDALWIWEQRHEKEKGGQ